MRLLVPQLIRISSKCSPFLGLTNHRLITFNITHSSTQLRWNINNDYLLRLQEEEDDVNQRFTLSGQQVEQLFHGEERFAEEYMKEDQDKEIAFKRLQASDENGGMQMDILKEKTVERTWLKGEIKYQQYRHRNIFKEFQDYFQEIHEFSQVFHGQREQLVKRGHGKYEQISTMDEKRNFDQKIKKDFIQGWIIWKDEDVLVRQFIIIFKELSRDFFQDFIITYLLKNKLQDLEIHLRSISPYLAAINQHNTLHKFRPISYLNQFQKYVSLINQTM